MSKSYKTLIEDWGYHMKKMDKSEEHKNTFTQNMENNTCLNLFLCNHVRATPPVCFLGAPTNLLLCLGPLVHPSVRRSVSHARMKKR